MTQAQLEDGRILEFPDETPPEVIQETVKKLLGGGFDEGVVSSPGEAVSPAALPTGVETALETPDAAGLPITPEGATPEESPGFIERVRADLAERGRMLDEIQAAEEAGEQPLSESLLQVAGKVMAGSVLDVIGEGVVSAIGGLSAITPDEIEDPIVQGAVRLGTAFLETDLGKEGLEAAEKGFAAYNEFSAENPRAARNIESVVDIGLLLAPIKGKPKVKAQPTFADKLATRVTAAGEAQTLRQKSAFVDDLVRPQQTKKVREAEILRSTEEGALATRTTELSTAERAMADEVGKIAEVGSDKTLLGNLNAIQTANRAEANSLVNLLAKNPVIIPKREFGTALDQAVIRLRENPALVGDAAKTATSVVEKMKKLVAANPGTASGLLQARKELDAFIGSQRPKVFDPATESALSIAVREVRQTTNDFIDSKATSVDVKNSLQKQSNLFRAVENIGPKAADEAGNSILRLFQRVARATDLGTSFSQKIALGLGLVGGGTALAFNASSVAPFLVGAAIPAGALFGAGKLAASATTKKAIGSLLRQADKAIRTTKDEALLAQLRADRGTVAEIFKQLKTEAENNE